MNKILVRILSCFIFDKYKRHKFIVQYQSHTDIYGNKNVIYDENAQELIKNKLNSDEPCLICRFGLTEFKIMQIAMKRFPYYKRQLQYYMRNIFPMNNKNLTKFGKMLFDITPDIDILACWSSPDEAKFCSKYCKKETEYINFNALTSITYSNPWTSALKDKKVLVIHPFEETIKEQYQKRELLFENKNTLPDFELITMKPAYIIPQDIIRDSNCPNCQYSSWFEALDDMKQKIETYDFDIAIIGAGPFGIFLADHCKKLGKKAVHVGGATQLLFGIFGARWENNHPMIKALVNEHWTRPSESEKPDGFKKIESGCYW